MENLITSSTEIYRLDTNGLHALDVKDDESETIVPSIENTPIRLDKIPTKKRMIRSFYLILQKLIT